MTENVSKFPEFRGLTLRDRSTIQPVLWAYQPETSELTFTNLFIWRDSYQVQWAVEDGTLFLLCQDSQGDYYGLPPVGDNLAEAALKFLNWLREVLGVAEPYIARGDRRLAAAFTGDTRVQVAEQREHFDYVYAHEALASLSGRKYSNKRNHINAFLRDFAFAYEPLGVENLAECLEVACRWCQQRRCEDDMSLLEERDAVRDGLEHFGALGVKGGVLRVDGRVEAFTIGELLNTDTVVVHIEKADPEIRGLYPMINQQFIQRVWPEAPWVNREQDLGEPGLRRAKESYYPDHLVEKYRITLR
ncbi:MAG: DUF2156 domain-containing protein [Anaerolineae bacterium]|nr:DUF2156 domain-containing protein [Anaerolineae bacterium]